MKIKKVILAAAAVIAITGPAFLTVAVAEPNNARIYTYYSDASMTEEVGGSGNGCHAGFSYGYKTPYYTFETFAC